MKSKKSKKIKLQIIRSRYELKRKSKFFVRRKKTQTDVVSVYLQGNNKRLKNDIEENLVAPERFSFINNTNEVLAYFNNAITLIRKKTRIYYDFTRLRELTPDSITLLSALFGYNYHKNVYFGGDAPISPKLQKLFTGSGLYDHLNSIGKKSISPKNKLWRHSSKNEVVGRMAGEAMEMCKNHLSGKIYSSLSNQLYNLMVEAMSNTIHHAEPHKSNKRSNINWWLFVYIDDNVTKYCFVDLGVGIFKSANFNRYRKAISNLYQGNQHLVEPFLNGEITSSRQIDNEISGKGIRQILSCATIPEFIKFYIITNDLVINIKTRESELLFENFNGTCIYWEIGNV